MDPRIVTSLVIFACIVAAVPWRLAMDSTEAAFIFFALAPPLLLVSGIGLREWSREGRHRV